MKVTFQLSSFNLPEALQPRVQAVKQAAKQAEAAVESVREDGCSAYFKELISSFISGVSQFFGSLLSCIKGEAESKEVALPVVPVAKTEARQRICDIAAEIRRQNPEQTAWVPITFALPSESHNDETIVRYLLERYSQGVEVTIKTQDAERIAKLEAIEVDGQKAKVRVQQK